MDPVFWSFDLFGVTSPSLVTHRYVDSCLTTYRSVACVMIPQKHIASLVSSMWKTPFGTEERDLCGNLQMFGEFKQFCVNHTSDLLFKFNTLSKSYVIVLQPGA